MDKIQDDKMFDQVTPNSYGRNERNGSRLLLNGGEIKLSLTS